ncbi:MAG: 4-hydroxybenzoate 3-monooxygenase [Ferruginibacter sp.]
MEETIFKTQIAIIGAGPAGLTLGLLLQRAGIDCIILELRSRVYAESRIRAGVLEQNTVDLYNELNVADRLNKEGMQHHGVYLSFNEERIRVPFGALTNGRNITIYGQQEVVKDLIEACIRRGITIKFEAEVKQVNGIETNTPSVTYYQNDEQYELNCYYVAGCDGFHGVAKKTLPKGSYTEYRKDYPFSWLGILAHAKPSSEELIYAYHQRGFALHSLRSETVSRLYIQVENDDKVENWSDDKIWEELSLRLHTEGFTMNTGEIFEKTITPMRSFMLNNLQYGKLFLAGDAAHIVPPTGGKGLNLAVADARLMAAAFIDFYKNNKQGKLKSYSTDCLRRIWRAQDFSNFMTQLFHLQTIHGSFEYQLQKAKFDYIKSSKAFATTIAENYVGLKEI